MSASKGWVWVAALLLAGCGPKPQAPAGAPPGASMPPPEVAVVTVTPTTVGLQTELPGRLEASRIAQVRARVPGILMQRLFREGSDVKAGQPLFRIDDAPLRATLQSAEATLARAQANLAQAQATVERYRPLLEANAISQQEYTNAQAAQKTAEADVAAGRAAVLTARINLSYATVNAPIAGRIGRSLVTEGALVGQGEATPLAVIQQIDPVYANFTQPSAETLKLRQAIESSRLRRAEGANAGRVRLLLEDGTEYRRQGKLLFSDLTVDPSSGQVMLRAEVPNPDGLLLPGMYVRVRFEQAQAEGAIVLPQQAVQRSPQGDSVMVVGADGKVAPRPVKLGTSQNGGWLVLDGLKAGEQVMVEGFQKLRGPAPVKAVPWSAGASAAGTAAPGRTPPPAASAASPAAPASPASAATAALPAAPRR